MSRVSTIAAAFVALTCLVRTAHAAVDPALFREDTTIGCVGGDVGHAGIVTRDVDGDGIAEIFVGHATMWSEIVLDAAGHGYAQVHAHELRTRDLGGSRPGLVELAVGDVDGDASTIEVVLLLSDGTIRVHDAPTGVLRATQDLAVADATGLAVADIEPGGGEEIVVATATDLFVFRLGVPAPLWTLTGAGGWDVAIGQVDADPAREIVVAAPEVIVVDVATRSEQWRSPDAACRSLDTGDIDGDGVDEIVTSYGDAIDVDAQSVKWSAFASWHCVRVVDVDGDGVKDVVGGDDNDEAFDVLDGPTGALRTRMWRDFSRGPISSLDVADVDGDCQVEVVFGADPEGVWRDHLGVASAVHGALEWTSPSEDGPMYGFAIGDVDADGQLEVVRAVDAEYNDGARVHVTSLQHARDESVGGGLTGWGTRPLRGMALAQLDADPALEYVMNDGDFLMEDRVGAFDAVTHERQWTAPGSDYEWVTAIAVGDVDADGTMEVTFGTGRRSTGGDGSYVRIVSGADGAQRWQSPPLDPWSEVRDIRVADVDRDGVTEVLCAVKDQGVFSFEGLSGTVDWRIVMPDIRCLDVADVDGDGDLDLLVGRANGLLDAFDGPSHAPLFEDSMGTEPFHAIVVADLDGDGSREIVVAQGPEEFSPDGATLAVHAAGDRSLVWRSGLLTGEAGVGSGLRVVDADGDGLLEILVGTAHAVQVFEYGARAVDARPPAFDGAVGVQRAVPSRTCCTSVDLSWDPATDARSLPVSYRIYRGDVSGFTPDMATLVGQTLFLSYRDADLAPTSTYFYVVHAVDGLGNEDANAVEASVVTAPVVDPPPEAPVVTVTDDNPCLYSGVRVDFVHSGTPVGVRYDLWLDGRLVASDVTSPVLYVPPGSGQFYVIEAVDPCGRLARSAPVEGDDRATWMDAPVIFWVRDVDGCGATGVSVEYWHSGFPGVGRYELLMDDVVVAEPTASPYVFVPPDSAAHSYRVRAVADCGLSSDSDEVAGSDLDGTVAAPTLTSIGDPDTCLDGLATVRFSPAAFAQSGHHELWRDGARFVSPVTDGARVALVDGAAHVYVVRAVDDTCSTTTDSAPSAFAPACPVGDPVVTVRRIADDSVLLSWLPPVNSPTVNVYLGTLESLVERRTYDHAKSFVGVTFPGSADPTIGCNAGGGSTSAEVSGLPADSDFYFLVAAVNIFDVESTRGRDSFGRDRIDPVVDPRPPAFFCP